MLNNQATGMPRGTTLIECVVALAILGAAMTFGAQSLGWSASQRRLANQRYLALQEAANCLERVRQLNWDELSDERLSGIELSPDAQQKLTSAKLQIKPQQVDGEPAAVRIHVSIQWMGRHGNTPLAVSLVTWRYKTSSGN